MLPPNLSTTVPWKMMWPRNTDVKGSPASLDVEAEGGQSISLRILVLVLK